jgi:hypothetical protein
MKKTSQISHAFLVTLFISFLGCSSNSPDSDSITVNPDPVDSTPTSTVQVTTYATVEAADGLARDSNGILYAANYRESKLYKITQDGTVSTFIQNQPGAAGMTFDNQGTLLLARYNNSDIVKISNQGVVTEIVASSIAAPIALAYDSHGNLNTNNNFNGAITKIDLNGNKTSMNISLHNNSSITVDDDDNLYVSDYDSGRIIKIDASTSEISTFTTLPVTTGGVGFIIHSNGSFFATAIRDHAIYKIDINGAFERIAGIPGVAGSMDGNGDEARFNKPNGIVTSSDGKTLYVAQAGSGGAIRVITGY